MQQLPTDRQFSPDQFCNKSPSKKMHHIYHVGGNDTKWPVIDFKVSFQNTVKLITA